MPIVASGRRIHLVQFTPCCMAREAQSMSVGLHRGAGGIIRLGQVLKMTDALDYHDVAFVEDSKCLHRILVHSS